MSARTSSFAAAKSPDSISMRTPICDASGPVDANDLLQQRDALGVGALESVPPADASEGAALVEPADLLEQLVGALGRASGEDKDAPSVERRLHAVADPIGQGLDGYLRLLDGLLRLGL